MRRDTLILLVLLFVSLFALFEESLKQDNVETQQKALSEFQIDACNAAEAADTCGTRLSEVGVVLKEDCCGLLGKCC